MKKTFLTFLVLLTELLVVLTVLSGCFHAPEPQYARFQTRQIGYFDTHITFIGYAQNEEEFSKYANILFDKLEEFHRLYDIFNPYEGLNNLYYINANADVAPVHVEQAIIDMLLAAKEAYEITQGMTNAAKGSVLRIWHEYRQHGVEIPAMEALVEASRFTNMEDVIIDIENGTVFFREPGMSLDVGSIAKGFAAGRAMEAVVEAGMQAALLSAGGHIVAHGQPPGENTWRIGIQNPDVGQEPDSIDAVLFTNASLSISGGYARYFEVGGEFFGHIIDPTTLMPSNRFKQVAVIHPDSWIADILSTALFILPIEKGLEMAMAIGAEALWIDMDNHWTATQGYREISRVFGVPENAP